MVEVKPQPVPATVEPDEEEDEPKSTLSPDVAEREAQRAIQEIEQEIDEERPTKRAKPHVIVHEGDERTFLDRVWERQNRIEARVKRIGHGKYSRVVKMARKPEEEEFVKASQITGIGIAVIGAVGFIIYLIMKWVHELLRIP